MKYVLTSKYFFIFFLIFFVLSFLYRSDQAMDQDLGRHLKLGEIIAEEKSVPKINLFSYTNPSFPFINTHYLFEVVFYELQTIMNINNFLIIKIIIITLSAFITLEVAKDHSTNFVTTLFFPIAFIFFHLYRERIDFRPEIFSFLFTSLTYLILLKFKKNQSKLIFLLPIIQLVWINTHIYFFVGFLLQGIFLIDSFFGDRRNFQKLFFILLASIFISLLNPNFVNALLYPLEVSKNYGYTIVENQTIFFLENIGFQDANFLFYKLSALIVIISIVFAFFKKKLTPLNLLLSFSGLVLATINVRSFPYLILISLPAVVWNFGSFNKKAIFFINLMVSMILIFESLQYLNGNYYRMTDSDTTTELVFNEHGKDAMDFVLKHNLPQPIFNNFDIGSYIIYRGYPKYKVFVDGRPEAYPNDFFSTDYINPQMDENQFKILDSKYHFETVIFSHTDQTDWGKLFLKRVTHDKDWSTVYFDDFMIVLVKADKINSLGLKPIQLHNINPGSYFYKNHVSYLQMGFFLYNIGETDSSLAFVRKALEVTPGSRSASLFMANLLSQTGNVEALNMASEYYAKSQAKIWW